MACTVCEERNGYQGKEHDISHCFRLGPKGKDGEERKKRTARKG